MGIPPLTFTGVSTYSADFQKILDRTVTIATQPIQFLQSEQTKILQQKTLALGLQTSVSGLGSAVRALGEIGANKAVSGTSSNTAKVTINGVTATNPANYTIAEITSVARSASASSAGFADGTTASVSATGTVRLTFQGQTHDIALNPSENNLTGLRDKINTLGAGLTATILTTGTGATPYYLSITSNTSGEKPITLVDDPAGAATNLLASVDNGANAVFKVNGVSVSKSSNLINDVVSGVTFTIAGTTGVGETVSLTLATNRTSLSAKLKDFVSAYNTLLADTDAQTGQAAGLLTGDFLVREAKAALKQLSGYAGTGTVKNLTALGITFGSDGKATFDQPTFDALTDLQIQDAFTFLGSTSSGFGGLQSKLTEMSDPVTGLIAVQNAKYDESDKRIGDQIEVLAERITNLQKSTAARLQAVDALLGSLQSQQTIIEASYKSLQLALFGKNDG
jgi:flagellar hook-associated protein 2